MIHDTMYCKCEACQNARKSIFRSKGAETLVDEEKRNTAANCEDLGRSAVDPNSRHYDAGGIETIEIIRAKLTPEQFQGFCLGNVIKYTARANFKGNFDRDIEKAGYYRRFLVDARK